MAKSISAWAALCVVLMLFTGCDAKPSSSTTQPSFHRQAGASEIPKADGSTPTSDGLPDDGSRGPNVAVTPIRTVAAPVPRGNESAPYRIKGLQMPEWKVADWHNGAAQKLADHRGSVVVVRLWTNNSQPCATSMPALQKLADEFAGKPVQFLGIFHSQGSGGEVPWKTAITDAQKWGIKFPIAYDRQWVTLYSWWLRRVRHMPTTPTFVLNGDGRVLHVHPGPEYHPSDEQAHSLCNQDFETLRAVIQKAVEDKVGAK